MLLDTTVTSYPNTVLTESHERSCSAKWCLTNTTTCTALLQDCMAKSAFIADTV